MSAAKPDSLALLPMLDELKQRFPDSPHDLLIVVSATRQQLILIKNHKVNSSYSISTAEAGLGNLSGSFKTPLGVHKIDEKIGEGAELGTIFKARKNTQKIVKILKKPDEKSDGDYITSRILRLSGMEQGVNAGGNVDSHDRYIYIHGTDEEGRLGTPASHGCVRMGNQEIMDLFDQVEVGTLVNIVE
ncbi:L,D-transpeptidase [Cocleimonas sp. KMM 6892]|uniref:L,D-transpeptidase n=1 Tax=unclassified Cocleimonas TaxID=2639732 RepID=UPI002DB9FC9A|nr:MULTISPECIES: L,D-transpeptidase [unclassified Cocleimonas]MEB8433471.1 L,D-transpeptidase [Cocleimonas sp. KMM 6892]MEC4716282.1 L,D-transpeptidase [Cocleimonas sp. KMM 6895]MEC4745825.1 L,D-transpeptidase [Cocleimonas sp. KMM 6896]